MNINMAQLDIELKYLFFDNSDNLLIIVVDDDLLLDIELNSSKKTFLLKQFLRD